MTPKLRVVVFTGGEITPVNRIFFERLAADPLIDLAAIVIDEYQPRRKPLRTRVVRALREDGAAWLAFKVRSKIAAIAGRIARTITNKVHGAPKAARELATPIHHVADIHSADSIALIQSLQPDLGVIVGGRILRDSVISIPKRGTLNIHKRKLPEYRGGGPVGYWEILAGETSIGVSIHFAVAQVDAGAVIAESVIAIEECDTLESLKLKADIRGAQLYLDAIRNVAAGTHTAIPQDLTRGTTYRAPSEFKAWKLQRQLERKAASAQVIAPARFEWLSRARVFAQFALVFARLRRGRQQLIAEGKAPISIFFYHVASNRPVNHLALPLMTFVRQIEFLRRHYAIVSLESAVERLRSGQNDELAASITFDDGYAANAWATEYLRYFRIPATFFVSTGHVRDASAFEHDRKRSYVDATPMSVATVRELAAGGFLIGSHGVHHEDFGTLTADVAEAVLRQSNADLKEFCGAPSEFFAFPKGKRGINITRRSLALALKHFSYVFSAYGGYAFPAQGKRHFVRMSNPTNLFDMTLAMAGYTGFRDVLRGNAWGVQTEKLDPCGDRTRIALIAASPAIIGGHSVQARALAARLNDDGHETSYIPIDVRFPRGLGWMRRVRYVRTIANELLYIASLRKITRADVVHVFSASYWSFLLGPVPAMLVARLLGKPAVLHYHSGEADDHLRRWKRVVSPLLRLADEIVVPSEYLERIFAAHGFSARVIPNVIETSQYQYRERAEPRPRLLAARNLEPHYRVDVTINAFARVKERFPNATLTIAGSGSEEPRLRALSQQLGIRDVEFVGAIDPSAMPKTYDAADVFVNASSIDNQPVSILEAFASGIPVVSTAIGDIPMMLRGGEAGVLVEADDASLADAVTRLLEDPSLSLRIARRARKEVERYTWPHVGAEWNTLYSELLQHGA